MGTGVEFLPSALEAFTAADALTGAAMLDLGGPAAVTAFDAATVATTAGAVGAAAGAAGASGTGSGAGAGAGLGASLKEALPYINAGTGLASLATTLGADRPGAGTSSQAAPALTDPTAMPEPFSQNKDVNAARRASIAEQMRRRGRASTILTDQSSDKLG